MSFGANQSTAKEGQTLPKSWFAHINGVCSLYFILVMVMRREKGRKIARLPRGGRRGC